MFKISKSINTEPLLKFLVKKMTQLVEPMPLELKSLCLGVMRMSLMRLHLIEGHTYSEDSR